MSCTTSFNTLKRATESANFDELGVTRARGWFSRDERRALYVLGRDFAGPILEFGSWGGLSTSYIGLGMRDSGRNTPFVTAELNPSWKNYRRPTDRIVSVVAGDSQPRDYASTEGGNRCVLPVRSTGNTTRKLRANLTKLGLISNVIIVEGGIGNVPNLGYKLVFCDAIHTPYETSVALEGLRLFLRDDVVIAFHDVTATNVAVLHNRLSFSETLHVGSLFVGRITNCPRPVPVDLGEAKEKRMHGQLKRTCCRGSIPSPEPQISIVLPTYNRAYLLPRAVSSVLRQTYADYELIIVDDGSQDATPETVGAFKDERIRYIRSECNLGVSPARNLGVRASRGRYVTFIDSDDEWLPELLESEIGALEREPATTGVAYSSFWLVKNGRQTTVPSRLTRLVSRIPSKIRSLSGDLSVSLQRGNFVALHAALIRRECFTQVGDFDERLKGFEDWDLWLRISRHFRFCYVPRPASYKYDTTDSLSHDERISLSAFHLIWEKHGSGSQNSELRAHLLSARGARLCKAGEMHSGRQLLLRALKDRPLDFLNAISLIVAYMGPRPYRSFARLLAHVLP